MSKVLTDMIGSRVAVWSIGSDKDHRDDGILREVDDHFLMIEAGAEFLCFPIANVRLVKILEANVGDRLLRAYHQEEAE